MKCLYLIQIKKPKGFGSYEYPAWRYAHVPVKILIISLNIECLIDTNRYQNNCLFVPDETLIEQLWDEIPICFNSMKSHFYRLFTRHVCPHGDVNDARRLFNKQETSYRKISGKLKTPRLDVKNFRIALQCDRLLRRGAFEKPVKYESDWKIQYPNPNIAVSRSPIGL